ncbi:MAG: sulfatase-like hydrolase/transferase [Alphaproteobacteria bacterium]|nr:sulfatase-like hydrolase/transferase [Alphaproteobacteria bacterium]
MALRWNGAALAATFMGAILLAAACSGTAPPAEQSADLAAGQSPQAAGPQATGRQATKARAPNIVVILADDLGYADISAYGSKRIATPNIDRVASEGVAFTDGYSAAPVCSPSRAGLNTGRYPDRFGFEFNNGPPARDIADNLGLPMPEVTLAAMLKRQGYTTGLVGKWHLGSNDDFYPTNRGYDEFVGLLTGATSYIDHTRPEVRLAPDGTGADTRAKRGAANKIVEGPQRTVVNNEDRYLTEYFGERGVEFIQRNAPKDNPFFLYLAFNAPHDPLMTTQKYYDRFPHIADEGMRVYASMVSALDDQVGQVIDAVEASGENGDTIIYFMSDNGCAAYIQGICSCEPLRGGKLSHYEGGVRVPFLMRWPNAVDKGQVYRKPVSTMDVFTTSVTAGGGKLLADRVYDGVDLTPFVTGAKTGEPHDMLAWRRTPHASIRKGDWKLWKSLNGEFTLLFNLAADPNEARNLAASEPARLKELEAAFDQWASDLQDPAWPSRPAVKYDVCGTPFELPI